MAERHVELEGAALEIERPGGVGKGGICYTAPNGESEEEAVVGARLARSAEIQLRMCRETEPR